MEGLFYEKKEKPPTIVMMNGKREINGQNFEGTVSLHWTRYKKVDYVTIGTWWKASSLLFSRVVCLSNFSVSLFYRNFFALPHCAGIYRLFPPLTFFTSSHFSHFAIFGRTMFSTFLKRRLWTIFFSSVRGIWRNYKRLFLSLFLRHQSIALKT